MKRILTIAMALAALSGAWAEDSSHDMQAKGGALPEGACLEAVYNLRMGKQLQVGLPNGQTQVSDETVRESYKLLARIEKVENGVPVEVLIKPVFFLQQSNDLTGVHVDGAQFLYKRRGQDLIALTGKAANGATLAMKQVSDELRAGMSYVANLVGNKHVWHRAFWPEHPVRVGDSWQVGGEGIGLSYAHLQPEGMELDPEASNMTVTLDRVDPNYSCSIDVSAVYTGEKGMRLTMKLEVETVFDKERLLPLSQRYKVEYDGGTDQAPIRRTGVGSGDAGVAFIAQERFENPTPSLSAGKAEVLFDLIIPPGTFSNMNAAGLTAHLKKELPPEQFERLTGLVERAVDLKEMRAAGIRVLQQLVDDAEFERLSAHLNGEHMALLREKTTAYGQADQKKIQEFLAGLEQGPETARRMTMSGQVIAAQGVIEPMADFQMALAAEVMEGYLAISGKKRGERQAAQLEMMWRQQRPAVVSQLSSSLVAAYYYALREVPVEQVQQMVAQVQTKTGQEAGRLHFLVLSAVYTSLAEKIRQNFQEGI